MNEPLKFKWHSLYGQMLRDRKLREAWKQVKTNKGSGGIDGETIAEFDKKSEERILEILEKLKTKTYTPAPVRRAVSYTHLDVYKRQFLHNSPIPLDLGRSMKAYVP